jgi:D-glycero-beta-D-manno-heptose 1-phosphate adenylyltransferase
MTITKKTDAPWHIVCKKKWIEPQNIESAVTDLRQKGLTIATLNGSFDLMHAGHLYIIFEAAKQADVLIVALNSDASIQKYKSPDRPIITLDYRLELLSALSFVDFVTWFDETDPRALLEKIRPNVHVNGTEYGSTCIEADVVKAGSGRLHLVDRIPGLATSDIIAKVHHICD